MPVRGKLLGRHRQRSSFHHCSQQHQLPKSFHTPHLPPFTGSAPQGSWVILPLATLSTAPETTFPYQSQSMTAGLLESAPTHRRRHRTRITFPSTTPVAWHQELALPCWFVLGTKKGAGMLPGWRGTHTRPTHRSRWVGAVMHPKVGGEPNTTLGSPWLVRPSSRSCQEWETCPLSPALTCPYEMDAMAPAVYRPTPGSSFCRSSAVLGIRPASSDTTWQGRGQAQGSSWGGHVQGTHFACGKMGSQPLQPYASSTAPARQGRHEPAPAQQPQRALEKPLPPHSSTFLAASCRRFPLE